MEEWKLIDIKGTKTTYEVSSEGRVRNTNVRYKTGKFNGEGLLKQQYGGNGAGEGYLIVGIMAGGKRYTKQVHQLVAEAFIGLCPAGKEIHHKDGDKYNNRPENLEYLTRQEHLQKAREMGQFKGTINPASGLTPWNKSLTKEDDPRLIGNKCPRSEETLRKMSESAKGKVPWNKGLTAETDSRIATGTGPAKGTPAHNKGVSPSEETRKRQSESAKRRHSKMTPEERQQLTSAAHGALRGRPRSEEDRKKISEGHKRRQTQTYSTRNPTSK